MTSHPPMDGNDGSGDRHECPNCGLLAAATCPTGFVCRLSAYDTQEPPPSQPSTSEGLTIDDKLVRDVAMAICAEGRGGCARELTGDGADCHACAAENRYDAQARAAIAVVKASAEAPDKRERVHPNEDYTARLNRYEGDAVMARATDYWADMYANDIPRVRQMLAAATARAEAENARLRKALEFYRDASDDDFADDNGRVARTALSAPDAGASKDSIQEGK